MQVMLAAYTIVTTVNVHLGYGDHAASVTQKGGQRLLEQILLINFADFALGIMSFTMPKLAIAALLNRIMNPGKFHRVWLWVLTGLVFVASSICIIVLFTMCDPPKAMWRVHLMAMGATCRPIQVLVGYAIFTGGTSTTCDATIQLTGQPSPRSPICTSRSTRRSYCCGSRCRCGRNWRCVRHWDWEPCKHRHRGRSISLTGLQSERNGHCQVLPASRPSE
jgi:hypothetical protein